MQAGSYYNKYANRIVSHDISSYWVTGDKISNNSSYFFSSLFSYWKCIIYFMCISIHSNGYTGIFLYDDKSECRIHHSVQHNHEHIRSIYQPKKTHRLISGGKGVINVDRVVINMSSLCLETETKNANPLLNHIWGCNVDR